MNTRSQVRSRWSYGMISGDTKLPPVLGRWREGHPSWLPWVQGSVWPGTTLSPWYITTPLMRKALPEKCAPAKRHFYPLFSALTTSREEQSSKENWLLSPRHDYHPQDSQGRLRAAALTSQLSLQEDHSKVISQGARVHRPSISTWHYGKASTYA